jgi:glycosyltransferase involved in cell wall biosynthesis
MTISIIVCTRNRADSLRLTLESIGRANVPSGPSAELLVVDNGSTDTTKVLVQSRSYPRLPVRYVSEPSVGKSFAYNTGMAAARGQIFLFTDDDVRVPADWIQGMSRPILNGRADAVAGGVSFSPVIAAVLARPPFSSRRSWFASTEELDRDEPGRMVGANMAFRRGVLDHVPGFDPKLGPGASGFHDETLFSWQMLAAGLRLVGALDIVVEHHFDTARLTKKGMIDLARKMGRSRAFVFHHWEHKRWRFPLPRLVLSSLRRQCLRCTDLFRGETAGVVSNQTLEVEQQMAFYREYLVQRRLRPKYPAPAIAPVEPREQACLHAR